MKRFPDIVFQSPNIFALLSFNAGDLGRRCIALAEFFAGVPHRPQQPRPILESGYQDLFHHALGELWGHPVQYFGRLSAFIHQACPVQIIRVPGFGEQAAVPS